MRIYEDATANATESAEGRQEGEKVQEKVQEKVSKHDALLAHLWSLIISARRLPANTTSYLDLTIGVRARVDPPLPDSLLGSPICHVAIPSTSPTSSKIEGYPERVGANILARRIREYLGKFGTEEISWILHDRASEVAPQRLWGACLGREHVLLTTWVRAGVYDVRFWDGEGGRPLWVEAVVSLLILLLFLFRS